MWTVSLSLKLALFLLVVSKICFWISARRLSSSADKLRCEEKNLACVNPIFFMLLSPRVLTAMVHLSYTGIKVGNVHVTWGW